MKKAALVALLSAWSIPALAVPEEKEKATNPDLQIEPTFESKFLKQGYRGSLKLLEGKTSPAFKNQEFEFNLLLPTKLKDGSFASSLAVGTLHKNSEGTPKASFTSWTMVRADLPKVEEIQKLKTPQDFEALFGEPSPIINGWSNPSESRSPEGWMVATPLSDGSIQVIEVELDVVTPNGGGESRVADRTILSGIFRPTGAPPKTPEPETEKQ